MSCLFVVMSFTSSTHKLDDQAILPAPVNYPPVVLLSHKVLSGLYKGPEVA